MTLKLLHTADWQIGRLPAHVEDDDAQALFEARLTVVERLAALAAQEGVAAVLVAGDVFDAQGVSDKTIRRLFLALQSWSGPWVLLPGNHDAALAESVWTRAQRLGVVPPQAVLCLTPQMQLVAPGVAVLPAPLTQRRTHVDLTEGFAGMQTPPDHFRIGLAHGSVQGWLPEAADSGNPIAAGRAEQARLDYLALGDWHGLLQVDARTWYAGTPEPDRFKAETAVGQALIVEIDAPGAMPRARPVEVGLHRWHRLEFDLRVGSDEAEVVQALAAVSSQDVLHLALRGVCDLAARQRLQSVLAQAAARVRAMVQDLSDLRPQPTSEDLEALQADGYLGAALEELRMVFQRGDGAAGRDAGADAAATAGAGAGANAESPESTVAHQALLILAQTLHDMKGGRA